MKLLVRDFQGCVSFLVLYVKFQDKVVMIVFLLFFQFIVMKLLGFSKKKKKKKTCLLQWGNICMLFVSFYNMTSVESVTIMG